MKNKLKSTNAITLIALVITIIIILILAGISISMISGNNGILNKTVQSKKAEKEATDDEKIKMVVSTALIDGLGKVDLSLTGALADELESLGITDYDGSGVVSYNNKKYIISVEGNIMKKNSFTSGNYGDEVSNYMDIDGKDSTNDWQIFYDDGSNVYLISKDLITLNSEMQGLTGMSANGKYSYWSMMSEIPKEQAANKYLLSSLQKDKFNAYVNTNFAKYAQGGPTIEMFVNSYNEKYPNGNNGKIVYKMEDNNVGYLVGWQNGTTEVTYGNTISGLDDSDNMYISPYRSGDTGYWLASPSGEGTDFIMCVRYSDSAQGMINYDLVCYRLYFNQSTGIRPIICLDSDVKFEEDGENCWKITK